MLCHHRNSNVHAAKFGHALWDIIVRYPTSTSAKKPSTMAVSILRNV